MSFARRQGSRSLDEAWQVLILRATHWQHLRPERSWRPIITLAVDLDLPSLSPSPVLPDLLLGSDGQNPNLRLPVLLPPNVHARSGLLLRVYYQPPGKSTGKGRKQRRLIGQARFSLQDALKQQAETPTGYYETKVSGTNKGASDTKVMSVCLRVRAPVESASSMERSETTTLVDLESESNHGILSDVDISPVVPSLPSGLLRRGRKKVKGFLSDDESCSASSSCSSDLKGYASRRSLSTRSCSRSVSLTKDNCHTLQLDISEIAPRLSIASISNGLSDAYDTATYYRELREATEATQVEALLARLVEEWKHAGGTLLAVAALDATVFGFNSATIFGVDGLSRRALTVSAITSALGLAIDAVLLFFYFGANARKFEALQPSRFYFALTSRLPLLAALISLLALAAFTIAVAYTAWPSAVLAVCGITGVLVGLQYIVRAGELLGAGIAASVREICNVAQLGPVRDDVEAHPPMMGAESRVTSIAMPPRAGGPPPRPPRAPRTRESGPWRGC
ncbi:hypothetical protein PENSPDRAFT_612864 [Peniophora sp. CONT]|nr:hypothetical protein PENSPDRAFT_612864 [Peniophora sp. CONT]